MPRNKTVSTNDIKPGTSMYVSGKIHYSHVATMIKGEELQRKIQRAQLDRRNCPSGEHTSISLVDARVMVGDPQNMTPAEKYASESLVYSKIDPQTNNVAWRLNFDNKSKFLPRVLVRRDGEKKVYDEVKLEHELDRGLDVTLCFSIYASNKGNNGIRLDTILVNEPLRYYRNDVISKLEQMGLVVNRLPEESSDTLGDMVAVGADDDAENNSAAPVQGPSANPFSVSAPAAPAAPTAPTAPVAPAAPVAQAPVDAAPLAPNPLVDPYDVGDLSGTPGGIVYNGDGDKY